MDLFFKIKNEAATFQPWIPRLGFHSSKKKDNNYILQFCSRSCLYHTVVNCLKHIFIKVYFKNLDNPKYGTSNYVLKKDIFVKLNHLYIKVVIFVWKSVCLSDHNS